MNPIKTLLQNCTGLNTVVDPTRIPTNSDSNISDLQYAVDVIITEGLRVTSADGYSQSIALTDGHSLFGCGSNALVMDGGTLCEINSALTKTILQTGYSGEPVCFLKYGNLKYFSNRAERGIIEESNVFSWEVDEYNGPNNDTYFETEIPPFDLICIHNGYMLGVIGNFLFSSELGMFGLWDLSKGIPFASDIQMIASVNGGIFVSDSNEVWFLAGTNCDDFVGSSQPVASYPAYKWSLAQDMAEGLEIGLNTPGQCVFWNSPEGLCLGGPEGLFFNLTKSKIVHPELSGFGATLLRDYRLISTVNESFSLDCNLKIGEIGSKATTQRSEFSFNSYTRIDKSFFGCKSDGVFLLGGTTCDGNDVNGDLETVASNYGFLGLKRSRFVYLEGEFEVGKTYEVIPIVDKVKKDGKQFIATDQRMYRLSFPYTILGDWWAFKVKAIDGGSFAIDSIKVLPIGLSRGFNRI